MIAFYILITTTFTLKFTDIPNINNTIIIIIINNIIIIIIIEL